MYDPTIYNHHVTAPSYWEATVQRKDGDFPALTGDASCDVAIIGGGFTGLSAALHLARNYGLNARVLEAGPIAWGASGRNGGFCCLPASKLPISKLIDRYGLEETKRFFAAQLDGMDLVKDLLAQEDIDAEACGNGNFEVAHSPKVFPGFTQDADLLTRLFGIETEVFSPEDFTKIGHGGQEQFGAMLMKVGFALHPLKFSLGMARAAKRHGATLYGESKVIDWQVEKSGRHLLKTPSGELSADQVIIATNGYTTEGLHRAIDQRVLPVLSNIIVTEPLDEALLQAESFHTLTPICNSRNLLFYYRRLPDRRILFGARGDTTGTEADGEKMRAWMTRRLGQVFPAWKDVPIAYFWRGLTCMTRKLTPSVGQWADDPSVWYGYGYHANGVNTAPWTGRLLAQLIGGNTRPEDEIPQIMAGPPQPLPIPSLRPWYLRGALAYYRLRDRISS
ncbi:MAG: FAD-dependent oxidoreductase [Pseudomonadota bacterium]